MEVWTEVGRLPRMAVEVWQRLAKRSSSNFKFAFFFLGKDQRDGLKLVYEFCRVVDDIVDERPPGPVGEATAREGLAFWRSEIARVYEDARGGDGPPQTDLGRGIARTLPWFNYPRHGFDEIIEGCRMDLERSTYPDFDELRTYCYRVASCVGLLCIGIFGDQSEAAQRYAVHLGLALQYTNILRDVAEDAARGRIYLPESLLVRHGVDPQDVFHQRYDARFKALARDFADVAEQEYRQAWKVLREANSRALIPAEIMGRTYYGILKQIRAGDFDVFTKRATLRRRDKLKVAAMAIARSGLTVV